MAPYNPQFEDQLKSFRKNRRLLVARSIRWSVSRADFEASTRARLGNPDSVIFFWPPMSPAPNNQSWHHMGYVMLAFNLRRDARSAEAELQNFEINGHVTSVNRASKEANDPSGSSDQQAAAPTATNPAVALATSASTTGTPTTITPPTTTTNVPSLVMVPATTVVAISPSTATSTGEQYSTSTLPPSLIPAKRRRNSH